jgi:hypothetical protein
MKSRDFATLAVCISQEWGMKGNPRDAVDIAQRLIYHQSRLAAVKGESEIEKILAKCRLLTGNPWEEEDGLLVGPYKVPTRTCRK